MTTYAYKITVIDADLREAALNEYGAEGWRFLEQVQYNDLGALRLRMLFEKATPTRPVFVNPLLGLGYGSGGGHHGSVSKFLGIADEIPVKVPVLPGDGNTIHEDGLPLNPWVPMSDPVDKKVVGKSMEEIYELIEAAARVGAAISRCFIQGIDEREPTTGKSNRQWLTDEVADVEANLRLIKEHFQLDAEEIEVRASMKWSRQRVWHKMPDAAYESKPVPTVISATDLIHDWGHPGRSGRQAKRETLTIPQMLGTLSAVDIRRVMAITADDSVEYFAGSNGWMWNIEALQMALRDYGLDRPRSNVEKAPKVD